MRNPLRDLAIEVKGHHEFTRDINKAIAAGDKEAADTFRTGTLPAALTRKGRNARGAEVTEYVQKVIDADGDASRAGWMFIN